MSSSLLAITSGEPAGIGPEIAIKAAWQLRANIRTVLLGDAKLLKQIAQTLNPKISLINLPFTAFHQNGQIQLPQNHLGIIDCPLAQPVIPGILNQHNSQAVLKSLDIAISGTMKKYFKALVTAPLQKSVMNSAGIVFSGHTEYLARKTGTKHVVMMLMCHQKPFPLRIALATTHLPLKKVHKAINFNSLSQTLHIINHDLQNKFGILTPRILVTGLNPHAGENGYLGREEIDIIIPTIHAIQAQGINVKGPYPADTLFQSKYLKNADCILTMYHDQGLPTLKFASFGRSVNITLGLPIIRTAVDHGTALDIAAQGLGHADHCSMIEAINTAALIANII